MTVLPRRTDDTGAVAIVVAILAVVLIGIAAFTTDFGMAYSNKRALSTAVDAAALAAANDLATRPGTCQQIVAAGESSARAKAQSHIDGAAKSMDEASTQTTPVLDDDWFKVECDSSNDFATVSVNAVATTPTMLAGVLGMSIDTVTRSATAAFGPNTGPSGLRPFAICNAFADSLRLNPTQTQMIELTTPSGGGATCGQSAGVFGQVGFNPGDACGPASANDTPTLECRVRNGYGNYLDIPSTQPVDPGNNTQPDSWVGLRDRVIAFPIYDVVNGNGNNAAYRVTGVMSARLCGYRMGNGAGQQWLSTATGCSPTVAWPPNQGNGNRTYFQLRFDRLVTDGRYGGCDLGAACDLGVRHVNLRSGPQDIS